MSDFLEFAQHNILLFVALLAIIGMLIGSEVLRRMRGVQSLNANEALRMINDQEAWIVDVRDASDYKAGHLPQARHIALSVLPERLDELAKAGSKPIIVYCRSGISSQSACAMLKKRNILTAYSLSGGIEAWSEAGLPLSRKS